MIQGEKDGKQEFTLQRDTLTATVPPKSKSIKLHVTDDGAL